MLDAPALDLSHYTYPGNKTGAPSSGSPSSQTADADVLHLGEPRHPGRRGGSLLRSSAARSGPPGLKRPKTSSWSQCVPFPNVTTLLGGSPSSRSPASTRRRVSALRPPCPKQSRPAHRDLSARRPRAAVLRSFHPSGAGGRGLKPASKHRSAANRRHSRPRARRLLGRCRTLRPPPDRR